MCLLLCLWYLVRAQKTKSQLEWIAGQVVAITNTNDHYPGKDSTKFRYLSISNYPKPFQLFIGKDRGDFKPAFQQIDKIRVADTITVYFIEDDNTLNAPVNNLVFFIDRGQETLFIQGNPKRYLLYGLIAFCVCFILVLTILKTKGKIH